MRALKKIILDRYVVYSFYDLEGAGDLIKEISDAPLTTKKGRSGIKVFKFKGRKVACRQYVHGGLFRAITGEIFFSENRAIHEMEVLSYLNDLNIPAVKPLCVIEEKDSFFKKLYLLTFFEDEAINLTDYLNSANKKERLRIFKKAAFMFTTLEFAGVYHPDLHLDNILVRRKKNQEGLYHIDDLIFVDFDRAEIKKLTEKDVEKMLWRLNRYLEKLERKGILKFDVREKLLFLRTYERLSKKTITDSLLKKYSYKNLISRIGWWLESFFYRT